MNKKILFIIFAIAILLGYIFKLDVAITNKIVNTSLGIKKSYHNFYSNIVNTIDQYINQQTNIKTLQDKLSTYKQYKTLYLVEHDELQSIQQALFNKKISLDVVSANVISYLDLNDLSKVILDSNLSVKNKIYPLITSKSYSAGIAMYKNGHIVGYLNPNPRSNYAVFVGDKQAPAITSGSDEHGNIILKYIPKWFKINIGDEVITSGMDDIFPHGIKVGKITGITTLSSTQNAVIKPYSKVLNKNNFYIIVKKHQ